MNGQVLAVISGKGGTGKTSFCAGVAVALCALGEKVLLIDADSGLRSLDIVLGMSDRLLFSYADVINGSSSLKEASVKHPIVKNLRVLTAPSSLEAGASLTQEQFGGLLDRAREHFTFVIVDCPAGFGPEVMGFAGGADSAVVVSTPDYTSLRGAQRVGEQVMGGGLEKVKLVLNRVRPGMIDTGNSVNIDAAMDAANLALLGVVPEDSDIIACGNFGRVLMLHSRGGGRQSFTNIARRLKGERIRLLDNVRLRDK